MLDSLIEIVAALTIMVTSAPAEPIEITTMESVLVALPASEEVVVTTPAVRLNNAIDLTDRVQIPSLQIDVKITRVPVPEIQPQIDRCEGATVILDSPPKLLLGAHRTTCGDLGFRGVETLTPGSELTLIIQGTPQRYAMTSSAVWPWGLEIQNDTDWNQRQETLALQTSLDDTLVILVWFQEIP